MGASPGARCPRRHGDTKEKKGRVAGGAPRDRHPATFGIVSGLAWPVNGLFTAGPTPLSFLKTLCPCGFFFISNTSFI